jgi:CubicO group peptidase (beta-lactamase class C family)
MADTYARLQDAAKSLCDVRERCGAPSISVGILHEGRVIFTYSSGLRDVEKQLPATSDTIYFLGSISKTLVSAAAGILVGEGHMSWKDKIQQHLPEFDPVGDAEIGKKADVVDVLRHSSGLANPVIQLLGPGGMLMLREEDFMKFVNLGPTENEKGQRYNREWSYSSMGYGVMAKVIERVSGMSLSSFVRERILKPLKMDRTVVSRSGYVNDNNLAYPYAMREDGSFARIRSDEWTSEEATSVLAAFGIRSSVNDMLKWATAILVAEKAETLGQDDQKGEKNPLREMATIRRAYWTRPTEDEYQNESAFCMGWFRGVMPSAQVGWGSFNSRTKFNKEKSYLNFIIGRDSPKRLFIKHHGILEASAAVITTFPETQSAVIAMTNGLNRGDAADWAAQIMIQSLFNLQPTINFKPLIDLEAKLRYADYNDTVLVPWLEHRNVGESEMNLQEFLGEYEGWAMTLEVILGDTGSLKLVFNGRDDMPVSLDYYNKDQYTFLPASRDEWVAGGYLDFDNYMMFVLDFKRDENGKINGLWWMWDDGYKSTWFEKKEGSLQRAPSGR